MTSGRPSTPGGKGKRSRTSHGGHRRGAERLHARAGHDLDADEATLGSHAHLELDDPLLAAARGHPGVDEPILDTLAERAHVGLVLRRDQTVASAEATTVRRPATDRATPLAAALLGGPRAPPDAAAVDDRAGPSQGLATHGSPRGGGDR